MNEAFAKGLYDTIIQDGCAIYADLFEHTVPDRRTTPYWLDALAFYRTLDESQKAVFHSILKQVMTDTVSGVLGMLDGSSGDFDCTVTIDGEDSEQELQDTFLEYVETL